MKIKNLQINVLALLFGLIAACFVNKIEASNTTASREGQQLFDQNGDNSSNQKQKNIKRGNASETLNWTFRGPDDVAGKVTSVVHDISNHLTVYVGAAHGGVWKSTTGGTGKDCWSKVPVENNKNLYVTCLALNEESNVLYAGTGGDFVGQGVYKAEGDGPLKLMAGTESWTHVSEIALSGNKIYAATDAGLMCYTDGAWKTCIGTKSGVSVTLNAPVKDISINQAGLVIIAMNKIDCYVSKTGLPDEFEYKKLDGNNLAVTTSLADNNILYAVTVNASNGKLNKAYLSEDQGDTWEVILSGYSDQSFIDPMEGNGMNINNIYADPIDPYALYVASRNIWVGKRYASGSYDFGLSAITISDSPTPRLYLHSNVRSLDFYAASDSYYGRSAYVATDGGIYRVIMYVHPAEHFSITEPLNKFLPIGSHNYVSANNRGWILSGMPTLGVQATDTLTNYDESFRPVWDLTLAGRVEISEGKGGACAISLINEEYYAYSLLLNGNLAFRRSINYGARSFQPLSGNPSVEWFSDDMLPTKTPIPKYDVPMLMWESFAADYTPDTVWFKADEGTNFYPGDRTIYAPSKNFNYPIEYTVPHGFAHGDSILVPDPIQNRMFIGLGHKIFMTREALNYEKNSSTTPMNWLQIATLNSSDTATVFALSDDANTLYVGTCLGNVHCITNLKQLSNSATLELVERTLTHAFTEKRIRAIAVDPTNANHLVVVLAGGGDNVYETYNGETESATFNPIKENLPNNVYSVLFPKGANQGTIIVGTEKGIWKKESSSNVWEANNNGIGEVPVMTLTQSTTYRPGVKNVPYVDEKLGKIRINYPSNNRSYLTIYAGTYGSGIFSNTHYVGIDEITSRDTKESNALAVIPNPVNDVATIELDMTKGHATIQIFSIDGHCIKEQPTKNNINTINFKDYAPGTYIIQVIQGNTIKSAKVIKK